MRGIDARLSALETVNRPRQRVVMLQSCAQGLAVDLGASGKYIQGSQQTEEAFVAELEERFPEVLFIWLVNL